MPHMEGIFINGEKAKFHPEDILDTNASQYTEEIGTATKEWLSENLTPESVGVVDKTLSIEGTAADAKETGNRISELKNTLSDVKEDLNVLTTNGYISAPVANWQDGYINESGLVANSSASLFALIHMSRGESIRVRTNNTHISAISYTDADTVAVGDYVKPLYTTGPSGVADFTYYAEENINIVICVVASNHIVDYLKPTKVSYASDLASNLYEEKDEIAKTISWNNGYIDTNGGARNSSGSQYALVTLNKGETIVIGTANDQISIISISSRDNAPAVGQYVSPYIRTTSSSYEEYSYTADQNVNIVICVSKKYYRLSFFAPRKTQEIGTINSIINDGYYLKNPIVNGSFTNSNQGERPRLTYDVANRIRTELIAIHKGDAVVINNGSFRHGCGVWRGSFEHDNIARNDKTWITDNETINVAYDGFLVITFEKPTDANINPSDFDGSVKVYTNVFNSLVNNQSVKSEVIRKIKSSRHTTSSSDSPLTLFHLSDLHKDTDALARISADIDWLGGFVDDAICTGDMVANTYEQISSWWNGKILTCIGNHDTASYSDSFDWTALSMADRDAYYIAPFEANWNIVHTSGKSYYYKDYTAQKVRLIVIDAMLYIDNGSEATGQNTWLTNLLNDAITNNLHVLIATHAPHGGATAVDCSFQDYNYSIMPTEYDCTTPQTVIDIVASAINNGLNFVGYICGHTHRDNIWKATEDGSQLMYCVTCANVSYPTQWIGADLYRSSEFDAYNIVTIDTARTLVKIVRGGGADLNDRMNTRKAICFNYSTGEKLGEVL